MPEFQVDEEISKVEQVYRQLTGSEPTHFDSPYAPIPPEVDSEAYVQQNLSRFKQIIQSLNPAAMSASVTVAPRVNIMESEKDWLCQVDVPGVSKPDVSVQLHQGLLRVTAIRRIDGNGRRAVALEVPSGRYERALPLPPFIKGETGEAKLENGVLNIRLIKDPAAGRRDVSVPVS